MKIDFYEMKSLIENYNSNVEKADRLRKKLLELLEYNTKITASYGINSGGSGAFSNSKIETYALKIIETEQELMEVEDKICLVNVGCKTLNKSELEVINLIRNGYSNKLTRIAKRLDKSKKYVYDTRNRAIRKMSEYVKD